VAAWPGDVAAAPAKTHERVAIIDLGPTNPVVRQQLAAAMIAGGLDAVIGDGVEDALAGDNVDKDAVQLAAAIAQAEDAFGKLDCKLATEASTLAIGIAAQRQAANLPVPELPRALAYVLLCADRAGDVDQAMVAARHLRTVGGSDDVPADVWKKYPELDTVADRELVPLELTADVKGAAIWVDFKYVAHHGIGTTPLTVFLPAGEHVIAAAAGSRRGWAAGAAIRTQAKLVIATQEHAGPWSEVAQRVAAWQGKLPAPQELGWVMAKVRARIAIVRRGDSAEVFGRIGLSEAPHRIGGEDGVASLAEVDRLAALIRDRVQTWNDRAPDPDRPLLVDDGRGDGKRRDQPTKWWVYASIVGAVAAGAVLIYANDAGSDKQRVELHQP
jgi:hypothetical protein